MFDSWVGKIYQLNMSSNDKLGLFNKIIRPRWKSSKLVALFGFLHLEADQNY